LLRSNDENTARSSASDDSSDELLYRRFRLRLVRYFHWHRCADPELCADDTLFRVERKLAAGEQVLDIHAYLFGVARIVARQAASRRVKEQAVLDALTDLRPAEGSFGGELHQDDSVLCLQSCLDALMPDQRELLLRYYTGSQRERIDNRSRLAAELGLGMNALRNRALRLRDRLEHCTRDCMKNGRLP